MDSRLKKSLDSDSILRCTKCGEIVDEDYESKLNHWEECLSQEDPEYATFCAHKKELS